MDIHLNNFLSEIRSNVSKKITGQPPFTHTTYYNPQEEFIISPNRCHEFWEGYCKLVSEHGMDANFTLAEIPQSVMPLIYHFTFRFKETKYKPFEEGFSNNFIHELTYCCQQIIMDLFEHSDNQMEFICCCLESEGYDQEITEGPIENKGTVYVMNLVLHFPYCRIESQKIVKEIYPKTIQILKSRNSIAKMDQQPIDEWSVILNMKIPLEPLPMYGSCKTNEKNKLILGDHIYRLLPNPDENQIKESTLEEIFYPMNHIHCSQNLVPAKFVNENSCNFLLPMLFSIYYWNGVLKVRETQTPALIEDATPMQFGRSQGNEDTAWEIAEALLKMINPKRFLEQNYWMDIGKSLYGLDGHYSHSGSDKALEMWKKFTTAANMNKQRLDESNNSNNNNNSNTNNNPNDNCNNKEPVSNSCSNSMTINGISVNGGNSGNSGNNTNNINSCNNGDDNTNLNGNFKQKIHHCEEKIEDEALASILKKAKDIKDRIPRLPFDVKKKDCTKIRTGVDCEQEWKNFSEINMSIKTLGWYAKEDSPKDYKVWHDRWCQAGMEKAISGLHTDVAEAFRRHYWLDFISYSISAKGLRWFAFQKHRWCEADAESSIRNLISNEFAKKFEVARTSLSQQIHESNDDSQRETGEALLKKLGSLIAKLKTVSYKGNVMREIGDKYANSRFSEYLDSNTNYLGLYDGILEVVGGKVIVRPGKPEDYISRNTGVSYRSDYTEDSPPVKELFSWFEKVFTDRDVRHHWLKFASSILKGRNSDKVFSVWTGDRDNSKSMIVKLFQSMLGPYCIDLPLEVLTIAGSRKSSGGPSPEMAQAKSSRLAFVKEPDQEEELKGGVIKALTGGDSFYARMLNENGGKHEATFKLVMMCNKPPIIPSGDQAVKQRLQLIPFTSTWVDNPPQDEEEQFKQRLFRKDPYFEEKIKHWSSAFLWILVQYYQIYVSEGLALPEAVKEKNEHYWQSNNVYEQFITQCIEFIKDKKNPAEGDKSCKVNIMQMYKEFKSWFQATQSGSKIPAQGTAIEEFSKKFGRYHADTKGTQCWYGIQIKIETVNDNANTNGNNGSKSFGGHKGEGLQTVNL